jgi:glyoxylate carboligase
LKARSILAAIDHNHHLHCKQARNSKGELVYFRRWSKRAKRWKVVIVKEKNNFSYLPVMTARVLKEASKTWKKHVKLVQSAQDPKKVLAQLQVFLLHPLQSS